MAGKKKCRGQIVNTSKSNGMNVIQAWSFLFQENEKFFKEGKFDKVLDDEQFVVRMLEFFPDRVASEIMKKPNKVRGRYNRGLLTSGVVPCVISFRYKREGSSVRQIPKRKVGKKSSSFCAPVKQVL